MIILPILFFVTAIIYSSVGFGGGSTYLALLLLWGVPYSIFPIIALTCNIIVVSGNSINYLRAGNLNFRSLIPYLIGSIPFAFIGGSLNIEKDIFEIILFFVLGIAGILLLFNFRSYPLPDHKNKVAPSINQVNEVLDLIKEFHQFGPTYIHCFAGVERSPLICMAWLVREKHLSLETSLQYVMKVNPRTCPLPYQLNLLKDI